MIASAEDPRDVLPRRETVPSVARPRNYISGPLIFVICAVMAVVLFVMLDGRRRALLAQRDRPVAVAQLPALPPPLSLPPAPLEAVPRPTNLPTIAPAPIAPVKVERVTTFVPPLPPQPTVQPQFQGPPVAKAPDTAPAMVIDQTTGSLVANSAPGASTKDVPVGIDGDEAVRATLIRNRASLIPQGTLIAAVLETPLNSDRPGLARAIISRDARSFDGSRVLIPRGSRLIGEFRADSNPNQRRVLVTWTRLIRPDGVAIRIGSPATDALGGTGIAGRVNTHFLERFSNAVLQSALTIGVEVASRSASRGAGSVFVGVPGQLGSVGQHLLPNVTPRTTVKVREGAEIAIFVAHDLDFGGTPPVR